MISILDTVLFRCPIVSARSRPDPKDTHRAQSSHRETLAALVPGASRTEKETRHPICRETRPRTGPFLSEASRGPGWREPRLGRQSRTAKSAANPCAYPSPSAPEDGTPHAHNGNTCSSQARAAFNSVGARSRVRHRRARDSVRVGTRMYRPPIFRCWAARSDTRS